MNHYKKSISTFNSVNLSISQNVHMQTRTYILVFSWLISTTTVNIYHHGLSRELDYIIEEINHSHTCIPKQTLSTSPMYPMTIQLKSFFFNILTIFAK